MTKKILFVTTDYSFFNLPITQALQDLGYSVRIFDYYKPNFTSRVLGLLGNIGLFPSSLVKKRIHTLVNQQLLKQVDNFKPDYLLVIKGETISSSTITAINTKGIITINWYSDWLDSWNWLKRHAASFSVFVNMCRETHRRLKKIGVNSFYLPVASPIDDPIRSTLKIYPISFVGAYTPRRERYFQAIKDLGLQIWGYRQWQTSSLKHIAHGPVSVSQARQIIRQSKITVNILNGSDTHQPDQINTRTVETTSVGSFLLVHQVPILSSYFRPGKEVATFITPQDLRQKAVYYLNHGKEREQIAQAGYLRAKRDHSLHQRLQRLFTLVQRHTLTSSQ